MSDSTSTKVPAVSRDRGRSETRICILTETYHPVVGGGETQARALAEGLTQRGARALVVTRRSHAGLARHEQIGGVAVHRVAPVGPQHWKKWGLPATAFAELTRLRGQYDVVFVSGFRVLGIAAVAARRWLGKPCILKADSMGEMSGEFFGPGLARFRLRPSSPGIRSFLRWRDRSLKRADEFVAISSAIATELADHGVEAARIRMIPNSVDTGSFRPAREAESAELRRRLGIPFLGPVAVYTGRLVSYKGLPILLRVWSEIRKRHPEAGLVLVGAGGLDIHNCERSLREFADAELGGSVHFAGAVDNVQDFLRACDLFVFPTETEAFGVSVIEAMACGLPVVSTAVGGLRDILEQEHNGLVVPSANHGELRDAILRLLADPGLRQRLGRMGRRSAEQRYSTPAVVTRYLELFERAAAGSP